MIKLIDILLEATKPLNLVDIIKKNLIALGIKEQRVVNTDLI
jgi:hypothetical protein